MTVYIAGLEPRVPFAWFLGGELFRILRCGVLDIVAATVLGVGFSVSVCVCLRACVCVRARACMRLQ